MRTELIKSLAIPADRHPLNSVKADYRINLRRCEDSKKPSITEPM